MSKVVLVKTNQQMITRPRDQTQTYSVGGRHWGSTHNLPVRESTCKQNTVLIQPPFATKL